MVSSILLHNFKCIALKLKKINKSERFLCHICPPCVIFARCSYVCFPFALETCYDLSSSSKCQGWKEAGFCTHPDHEEALIHWCPKTCYNCKFVYFRVSKTYFWSHLRPNQSWHFCCCCCCCCSCCHVVFTLLLLMMLLFFFLPVFWFVCFVNRLIPDRKCI